MNSSTNSQIVIVGVLNWGLGHATRCVPIIKALEESGLEPILASDGEALNLLRETFPHLRWEELPGYKIKYSRKLGALASVIIRSPLIWKAARSEKKRLESLVKKYKPVGIFSDNRLGFYQAEVPSVYMSHQLKLMLPFARGLVSSWHYQFIRKFDQCWIPDISGVNSLAGEMTQNIDPGVPAFFIGPLSRFQKPAIIPGEKEYRTCTVLSGPEPQRSVLEKKLYDQLSGISGKHLFIRGSRQTEGTLTGNENIEVIDFLSGNLLAEKIGLSQLVISRSGYSSLMDYWYLGNRALLIPTPGQPEQEYLARYMLNKGWFFYADQERLNLSKDISKAMEFEGLKGGQAAKPASEWKNLLSLFKGKGKGGA